MADSNVVSSAVNSEDASAASNTGGSSYSDRMKRLRELHMRRNEARKLNHAEVVEEDRRSKLPANHEQRKRRQDWQLEELDKKKECEAKGEDYDRVKLLDVQADLADKLENAKQKKKNPDKGFSDYEAMTQRTYERLTKSMKPDLKNYQEMRQVVGDEEFYPTADTLIQGSHYPSSEAVDRLVGDLAAQKEKRMRYHRRRTHDPDAPIDYINERNKRFNARVDKFYSKYTAELKEDLERGTAV